MAAYDSELSKIVAELNRAAPSQQKVSVRSLGISGLILQERAAILP